MKTSRLRRFFSRCRLERLEDRLAPAMIAWDGGNSTLNWGDAKNWVGDVLPMSGDEAIIGPAFSAITVTSTGSVTIDKLTSSAAVFINGGSFAFNNPSSTAILSVGNGTLTADAALSATVLNQFGGVITGSGNISVSGDYIWNGGGVIRGTGKLILDATSTGKISTGTNRVLGRVLENSGNLTYNGSGLFVGASASEPGVLNNQAGGTLTLSGDGDIGVSIASAGNSVVNAGKLIRNGTLFTVIFNGVTFNNTGAIDVQEGSFTVQSGTVGGSATIAAGADFTLNVAPVTLNALTSGSGTIVISSSTVTTTTPTNLSNVKVQGGTFVVNAATSISTLTLTGGTLTGTETVTVPSSLTWNAGIMSGTGKTVLASSAISSINNSGSRSLGRTLENAGQLTYNGTQGLPLNFGPTSDTEVGVINNLVGGTFTCVGEGDFANVFLNSGHAIVNAGTFIRTGAGETFLNGVSFNNTGSVFVQQGKFRLISGGSVGGAINIAAGAELRFTAGTPSLSATVSGLGSVTITGTVSGVMVTIPSPVSIPNLTFTGGTIIANAATTIANLTMASQTVISGTGVVTISQKLDWNAGGFSQMIGNGKTVIAAGATGTFAAFGSAYIGRTLDNAGSFTFAGSGLTFGDGVSLPGVFNNLAGATFTASGDGDFSGHFTSTAHVFNNSGTFIRTGIGDTKLTGIAFNNTGTIKVQQGSFALASASNNILQFDGSNYLTTAPGSSININGNTQADLFGATTNADQFNPLGTIVIQGGTMGAPRLVEAMSRDQGNVAAGFNKNFAFGSLQLNTAYVKLVDNADNAFGAGAEALYLDSLVVPAGSTLALNSLKVYARTTDIGGSVIGGTITSMPDGGAIILGIPTSGTISAVSQVDEWTFYGYANDRATIFANPGGVGSPPPVTPTLGFAKVELVAPNNSIVDSAFSNALGNTATLLSVTLPATGTYRVRVRAADSNPSNTGNYLLSVYGGPSDVASLPVNQNVTGLIDSPYGTDRWTFSAAASRQIRLNVLGTASSALRFKLTGPNSYIGFDQAGSTGIITLPNDGAYALEVYSIGSGMGAYTYRLDMLSLNNLTLGANFAGTLTGPDDAQVFKVNLTQGNPLTFALDDTNNTDRTELYVKLGAPPTRQSFDFKYDLPNSADHLVPVPFAAPGDWYALVYGERVATASNFTIRAVSSPIVLNDISPNGAAANPMTQVTIRGVGFLPGLQVELRPSGGGSAIVAQSIDVDSIAQVSATFDLTGAAIGNYDVWVALPGGANDTLSAAFAVQTGGTSQLETNLIIPSVLGRHGAATLYVEYKNSGTIAMPAPILVLQSADDDNSDKPLLSLDQSGLTTGFWTSALPDGFSNSVQIYATGASPGLLLPGEQVKVPVYYAGLQQPWDFSDVKVEFEVRIHDAGNNLAIDWPALQNSLRPSWIAANAWPAIYANLQTQIGETWGDYVRAQSDNASYLDRVGEPVNSSAELYNFELQQANGLSPVSVLASSIDAAMPTPGLPLSFGRSFGNSISERYQLGAFGRGWSAPWMMSAQLQTDGTVILYMSADSQRRFKPDSRYNGQYLSQPGDTGSFRIVSGGNYELKEINGQITQFKPDGKLDFIQDANGNRITAGFSGILLTSLTHSNGASLTLTYNPAGHVASITDSAGRSTTFVYDVTDNYLLSATGPTGTTTYTYSVGNGITRESALTSITPPGGVTKTLEYDTRGRLIASYLIGNIERIDYAYDSAGGITATNAAGVVIKTFFDQQGQIVRTEDGLGNYVRYEYDADGLLERQVDSLGHVQSYTWCDCGQVTSITDELGRTTTVNPDGPNHHPTALTDANGNVTQFSYDAVGNPTGTLYPDGSIEQIAYNAVGDPIALTNRRGQTMTLTRNAAGLVTAEVDSTGTSFGYTYDTRGRMTSSTTSTGTTIFTYDAADRLTRVDYPNGRWLQYAYDAANRRTQMLDHTGYAINYGYDGVGRLATLRDAGNFLIQQYTYDAAGRLVREDKGNGTYTINTYDSVGRLAGTVHYAPGGTVNSHFDYTYDALGQRTAIATSDGTWTYSYDLTGQLTRAVFASTNVSISNQDLNYSYDNRGNRIQTVLNGVTTNYTSNNLNLYTSAGSTTFGYDLDGNLIQETGPNGSKSYGYDIHGLLTNIVTPSETWQYEYDAFGNRTASLVNGQRTEYLLDPLGQPNVVATYDGAGSRLASFAYGRGLEATYSSSQWSYYDFDGLGSTAGISAISGNYVNKYVYDPFGGTLLNSETMANSFKFVGQSGVASEGNGLNFMQARFYSAAHGRFLSADPLGISASDSNLQVYAGNDPVNSFDPLGLHNASVGPGTLGEGVQYTFQFTIDSKGCVYVTVGANLGFSGTTYASAAPGEVSTGLAFDPFSVSLPTGALSSVTLPLKADANYNPQLGTPSFNLGWFPYGINFGGLKYTHLLWCPDPPPPPPPPPPPTKSGDVGSADDGFSADPNEKDGAAGFGPEHFVDPDTGIAYKIKFENLGPGTVPTPTQPATAPAQRIEVTDQLSTNLDWATLRFTEFGWGDINVTVPDDRSYYFTSEVMIYNGVTFNVDVEMSFNSATGLLRVVFQSIDHATQLPPDVLIGLLPPEDGTGRGQGYFGYTVQPKSTLTTGTEIRNVANIRFDINPIIATNQIDPQNPAAGTDPNKEALNTIDAGAPTSSVLPLPAMSHNGHITWAGMDDVGGSGIGGYDIYVSDNGGPFTLWLANTPDTAGIYIGQNGHTYGFYSVAIDNVGNRQPTPSMAQATTMYDIRPATVQQLVVDDGSGQRSRVKSITVTFDTVVQFPMSPSSAFQLIGPGGAIAIGIDTSASTPLQTIAKLTFSGTGTNAGSLADGNYDLTLLASQIQDLFGNALDGDGNGTGGDNYTTPTTGASRLYRLFGDANGDRIVSASDFSALRLAYGQNTPSIFDFDGDNLTNANDFEQFRLRYGITLVP